MDFFLFFKTWKVVSCKIFSFDPSFDTISTEKFKKIYLVKQPLLQLWKSKFKKCGDKCKNFAI